MEQKHLENLRLKKKQETVLVRVTEEVGGKNKGDIPRGSTASALIFQYTFNWQKRNKEKKMVTN